MTNEENKKRWKEESAQLKEDLKNRKKRIVKREVEIKFPKKNSNPSALKQTNKTDSNKYDHLLKNHINFKNNL
ncbi:MAG: hypothetical protein VW397_05810 [Candidatus Margulisiibacteriota bacterium]